MMLGRCAIEGSFFASSSISVNIRCNLQGKDAAGSMFMVAGFDLKGAAVMVQDESVMCVGVFVVALAVCRRLNL